MYWYIVLSMYGCPLSPSTPILPGCSSGNSDKRAERVVDGFLRGKRSHNFGCEQDQIRPAAIVPEVFPSYLRPMTLGSIQLEARLLYTSAYITFSFLVIKGALMMHVPTARLACATTSNRCDSDIPNVIDRASSSEWSGSGKVIAKGSPTPWLRHETKRRAS
jgi:hypothetical protein